MPYPLLISERGCAASAEEDCSGFLRSNVEEGSADLDQTHTFYTDIGQIIRMLQELMNDVQKSTVGEYSIKITLLQCQCDVCCSPNTNVPY